MLANLLLDFLDRDSREIFGTFSNFGFEQHITELTGALNVAAFLCSGFCAVPPGFLASDALAAEALLRRRPAYLRERLVRMPLREPDFGSYWEKKEREFRSFRGIYPGMFDPNRRRLLEPYGSALLGRRIKAGDGFTAAWQKGADSEGIWREVTNSRPAREVEHARDIPSQLRREGSAVIWPAIRDRLASVAGPATELYRPLVQYHYFSLYVAEYSLAVVHELPFARRDFVGHTDLYNNYESLRHALLPLGVFDLLLVLSAESLLELRARRGYYDFCELYAGVTSQSNGQRDVSRAFAYVADQMRRTKRYDVSRQTTLGRISPRGATLTASELDNLDEQLQAAAVHRAPALAELIESQALSPRNSARSATRPLIAIFVALQEERDILRKLWSLRDTFPDPVRRGIVGLADVELLTANAPGRVPAAVAVMKYLGKATRKPAVIVVAGIAGGVAEEEVDLGDVILPTRIFDLAYRKVRVEEEKLAQEFRPKEFPIDDRLLRFVESDAFDLSSWTQEVVDNLDWPAGRRPTVRHGPLASVDEVVASDEWRETLRRAAPKLQGVEMEAGGVCAAALEHDIPVFVARGISDQADPMKTDTAWRKLSVRTVATLLERALNDRTFVDSVAGSGSAGGA